MSSYIEFHWLAAGFDVTVYKNVSRAAKPTGFPPGKVQDSVC